MFLFKLKFCSFLGTCAVQLLPRLVALFTLFFEWFVSDILCESECSTHKPADILHTRWSTFVKGHHHKSTVCLLYLIEMICFIWPSYYVKIVLPSLALIMCWVRPCLFSLSFDWSLTLKPIRRRKKKELFNNHFHAYKVFHITSCYLQYSDILNGMFIYILMSLSHLSYNIVLQHSHHV